VPRTWPKGPKWEMDVGEASDKPRRVAMTKRVSLRDGVNSLVISWPGIGVARVLRMNTTCFLNGYTISLYSCLNCVFKQVWIGHVLYS
jgi:hypothetical protein